MLLSENNTERLCTNGRYGVLLKFAPEPRVGGFRLVRIHYNTAIYNDVQLYTPAVVTMVVIIIIIIIVALNE